MKKTSILSLFTLLVTSSIAAHAGGDAEAGKAIAGQVCQTCHGVDGNSANPQFPRLAGQYANYLEHTLNAYKSGKRTNPIMAGQVAGLSAEDIKNVAAWYASQSGLTTPELPSTVNR